MYPVTTISASVLSLFFVIISLNVVKLRVKYKVSMGTNGHEDLKRTIRAHGNFSEYVPVALVLMLCSEANHANWKILSILAALLILGRVFHAYAFIFNIKHLQFRQRGMVLTFIAICCLALLNMFLLITHA